MAVHTLKSPVIVFNHPDYGARLLFQKGETNPRNELGKNGVTLYQGPKSIFYRTIKIRATQLIENGKSVERTFVINRNSLIKYIGPDANKKDSDTQLIEKLENKLWKSSDLNNASSEDTAHQINAGEHLRHAGQHNKRPLQSHWFKRITNSFKSNFLSKLYHVSIRSTFLIKLRIFFFGKEKDILKSGEILANKRYQEAYAEVPAYKQHLIRFNGKEAPNAVFRDIPITSKENYIKYQQYDSDTHRHGKYPKYGKTDTSTGTTGKATAWVRNEHELDVVKRSLALAIKFQFGNRKLNFINAFALGPWATGLTVHELMRDRGSVFATGPDKEKILDELLRIAKYEQHQLELAVNHLQQTNPNIREAEKKLLLNVLDRTLKAMLRNPTLKLEDALNAQITPLSQHEKDFINLHKNKIKSIVKKQNKERSQIVIAGYPPFLKDFAEYAKQQGKNLADFSVIGIVGGQAISEAMRDRLEHDGFIQIRSSYGASDLDINLGTETDFTIQVRKSMEKNPGLARELCGKNKGLPMVFSYDPMNYQIECLDTEDEHTNNKNSLIFTATRDDRSSPRIRYDLGDKGRIHSTTDVQAALAKYGIFSPKPSTNLPLVFVWGRDSTVVYNGANLSFTELERAITELDPENKILKKAFYTYVDEITKEDKLEIWLELNEGIEMTVEQMNELSQNLFTLLTRLNQDFRYQIDVLSEGTALPSIRFFKRKASPISEAGGHRKQVLVFQKEDLPHDFQFPENKDLCYEVTLPKNNKILNPQTTSLVA